MGRGGGEDTPNNLLKGRHRVNEATLKVLYYSLMVTKTQLSPRCVICR